LKNVLMIARSVTPIILWAVMQTCMSSYYASPLIINYLYQFKIADFKHNKDVKNRKSMAF
jgi:hypothetical protein